MHYFIIQLHYYSKMHKSCFIIRYAYLNSYLLFVIVSNHKSRHSFPSLLMSKTKKTLHV